MVKNFGEIYTKLKTLSPSKIAVAAAHDSHVLEALNLAIKENIAKPILVGSEVLIREIAKDIGMDLNEIEIINEEDNSRASEIAAELVSTKKADMLMKGLVDTATFLKAVLNKETGLRGKGLLSHVAVFEIKGFDRLIYVTDAAFNIAPDLNEKTQILLNAVKVAKAIGVETPKVAAVCAVEVVNENMKATLDASALSMMNKRGQIKGCIVDGPLALDNSINLEAAIHKNINSEVAGRADILLMPNIEAANVMYKTLTYLGSTKNGGILVGTTAPVIVTSRADSREVKLNSIAIGALFLQK